MVIQKFGSVNNFAVNIRTIKSDSDVRHEFHHFIWNFLERDDGFVRPVEESSPEEAKAFDYFRDEIAAYIIEGRNLGEVSPKVLTYSEEPQILHTARNARDYIILCLKMAQQMGADPQSFLIAPMSSRNFGELAGKFTDLVPIHAIGMNTINAMYSAWANKDVSFVMGENEIGLVTDFLSRKKLTVPAEELGAFELVRILSDGVSTMQTAMNELEQMSKFREGLQLPQADRTGLLEQLIRHHLPYPPETVRSIAALPDSLLGSVYFQAESAEDFFRAFISFWNANDEETVAAYKKIVDSSPEMRSAYNAVKAEIIQHGEEDYRSENGQSESKRVRVEQEIRERSTVLMGI
jgi:hypothetical protein